VEGGKQCTKNLLNKMGVAKGGTSGLYGSEKDSSPGPKREGNKRNSARTARAATPGQERSSGNPSGRRMPKGTTNRRPEAKNDWPAGKVKES